MGKEDVYTINLRARSFRSVKRCRENHCLARVSVGNAAKALPHSVTWGVLKVWFFLSGRLYQAIRQYGFQWLFLLRCGAKKPAEGHCRIALGLSWWYPLTPMNYMSNGLLMHWRDTKLSTFMQIQWFPDTISWSVQLYSGTLGGALTSRTSLPWIRSLFRAVQWHLLLPFEGILNAMARRSSRLISRSIMEGRYCIAMR